MLDDGQIIITDIGDRKLNIALGSESAVVISHVALGDGGGVKYVPGYAQTELENEVIRAPIARRHVADDHAWRIAVEFGAADLPNFTVREIGFFDEDGDLIYLWAGTNIHDRQLGAIDYLLDQVLDLSHVQDGLVIVNAPDDALFDLTVTTSLAIVNLQTEQLRQAKKLKDLTGSW